MNKIAFYLVFAVLILLQIFFGSETIIPNFALVGIIVLSLYVNFEGLLYSALISGLVLDTYSGVDFGFYISWLIFVSLFLKFVLKFGERKQSMVIVVSTTALLTILYNFLILLPIFSAEDFTGGFSFLSQLGVELVYNCILVIVAFFVFKHLGKYLNQFLKGSRKRAKYEHIR